MNGPLKGIKVLDLSRILAGPWAAQLLGDYGADVIKIERPGPGDDTRGWGPPWLKDDQGLETHESAYFLAANRNKRSVTVDLAAPAGQQVLKDLAARSDVLIENFRVGSLARFKLDWRSLREVNPALIYCSISAYGQVGSRSKEPGYDAMMQASAGLMSLTGAPDEEGGSPQKVGVAVCDMMAGMYAVTAILAALQARQRSGSGQHIDIPLFDSQVAWLANQGLNYLVSGEVPKRLGTAHPNIVPYQAFQTEDGYLMLAVGNDRQFCALAECLGCPEIGKMAKYSSNAARVKHRSSLVSLLSKRFQTRKTAAWLDLLLAQRIPAGPINDVAQVFATDYAEEAQLVRYLPHAAAQSVPTLANPVHFSATPVEYRHAPPLAGQHTVEVLRDELGYTEAKIAQLQEEGAI